MNETVQNVAMWRVDVLGEARIFMYGMEMFYYGQVCPISLYIYVCFLASLLLLDSVTYLVEILQVGV